MYKKIMNTNQQNQNGNNISLNGGTSFYKKYNYYIILFLVSIFILIMFFIFKYKKDNSDENKFTLKIYNGTEEILTPGLYTKSKDIVTVPSTDWSIKPGAGSYKTYTINMKDDVPLKIWLRYGILPSKLFTMGNCPTAADNYKCTDESDEMLTTVIVIKKGLEIKVSIDNSNGYDTKYNTIIMNTKEPYSSRFNADGSYILDKSLIYSVATTDGCAPENRVYSDKLISTGVKLDEYFDITNTKDNTYSGVTENKTITSVKSNGTFTVTNILNGDNTIIKTIRKKDTPESVTQTALLLELFGLTPGDTLTPEKASLIQKLGDSNYILLYNIGADGKTYVPSFAEYVKKSSTCYTNDKTAGCAVIGCRSTCHSIKNNWMAQYINNSDKSTNLKNVATETKATYTNSLSNNQLSSAEKSDIKNLFDVALAKNNNFNKWRSSYLNTSTTVPGNASTTDVEYNEKKCMMRTQTKSSKDLNLFCKNAMGLDNKFAKSDSAFDKAKITDAVSNKERTMENLYCCNTHLSVDDPPDLKYEKDYSPAGFDPFTECKDVLIEQERNKCLAAYSKNSCPIITRDDKKIVPDVMKNSLNEDHLLTYLVNNTKDSVKNWFFQKGYTPIVMNKNELEIIYTVNKKNVSQ